ncbi:MAG TPA: response regulator [Actinomycetota bacterium]|nr:response regulator [Actinomycetota bacterium]
MTATAGVRVLVVDDEPAAQRVLSRILQNKGYQTEIAADVPSALELIEQNDFALVMTDLDMPGRSGLELIEALSPLRPQVATVLVTGRGSTDVASTALSAGAYGYMSKPFHPDEVEITVLNALRRRELEIESRGQKERLEQMVRERTRELMESLAELETAQEELRRQAELLRELDRMKAQFIQVVSHELRTPLTVIRGGVQTVLRSGDSIDPVLRQQLLTSAETNAEALSRMINKILMASAIRQEAVDVHEEQFRLDELVQEVVGKLDKGSERVAIRATEAPARGQRELTAQAARDLIENALLYSTGQVMVSTWQAADEAAIAVADHGPGIQPDLLRRLLEEPFVQGDSSTTRSVGGLGLSLYLARRIAEASGGRLDAQSGPDGSTFSIVLPAGTA